MIHALARYARERLWTRPVMAAAPIVWIAVQVVNDWRTPLSVVADGLMAILLVWQFRIWDDVADRERDARRHPDRVIVQAPSTIPFVLATLMLVVANTLLVVWRSAVGGALATLATLTVVLAVYYARRGARSLTGDHLLLLKYPVFVVVIAGGPHTLASLADVVAISAVYLAACAYEAWHDPTSPLRSRPRHAGGL